MDIRTILTRDEFVGYAKSGAASEPVGQVRKEFAVVEASADRERRTVKFVITTNDVDRDNDVIDPKGWDVSDYMRSPVVLWAHDYKCPPIARALDIVQMPNGLASTAQFPAEGVYPFADMIFNLVAGGFIRSSSVGFRPVKYRFDDDRGGVDFMEQSLLEWSIVPVPANPHALVSASAAGISLEPMKQWVKSLLADWPEGVAKPEGSEKIETAETKTVTVVETETKTVTAGEVSVTETKTVETKTEELEATPEELPAVVEPTLESKVDALAETLRHLSETVAQALAAKTTPADDSVLELTEDDVALELSDDDEDGIDLDRDDLKGALGDVIGEHLRALALEETRKAINQVRGRLD
jgi:HK97 family phage prohead protease